METPLDHIVELMRGTTAVPLEPREAIELGSEYPFFILPAILALRDNTSAIPAEARETLMRQIALNAPDPQHAFMLADVDYREWLQFYPSGRTEVSTVDAITKFLDTYGHSDPREEELLERLIFNPTPDYASMLEREEREQGGITPPTPTAAPTGATPSQDDLIASFILKHRDDESALLPRDETPVTPQASSPAATSDSIAPPTDHTVPSQAVTPGTFDSSLSESLAKIYIRQKRYDKAFEIIHTLSLNNPKKSVYFADQLRFLRKLMLNRPNANNSK